MAWDDGTVDASLATALARTHAWFEANSGWAPPDPETLADWRAEGVCRCPDECLVVIDGVCAHGLASWNLVLAALAADDAARAARLGSRRP
ncbi:MAG: hypothetical protein JWN46_886 [Acidimicrobiales bacterium]|nr:hypothetical protein [Acidimicrobiales bacterium]